MAFAAPLIGVENQLTFCLMIRPNLLAGQTTTKHTHALIHQLRSAPISSSRFICRDISREKLMHILTIAGSEFRGGGEKLSVQGEENIYLKKKLFRGNMSISIMVELLDLTKKFLTFLFGYSGHQV